MLSGRIKEQSTFIQFADLTVEIAKEEFDEEAANIVRKAWDEVGVTEKSGEDGDDKDDGSQFPCWPM